MATFREAFKIVRKKKLFIILVAAPLGILFFVGYFMAYSC